MSRSLTADHDVIVIGAGHNGLVAACELAGAGLDVLVVEAAPTIGGMTSTQALIDSAPEHRVNPCAVDTVFLAVSRIERDFGLARYGYRPIPVDPPIAFLHPDGPSIALWRGDVARTVDEIRHFDHQDAAAYETLIREMDALLDLTIPMMTSHPLRPGIRPIGRVLAAAARHRRDLRGLVTLLLGSAAQAIDERFRHPVVRDGLAALCAPWDSITIPNSAMALTVAAYYHRFGANRIAGGTQGLPDALAAALAARGGAVRCEAPVEEIEVTGGRATGVRLANGERLTARRGVIASCDPGTALGRLLPAGTLSRPLEARLKHLPTYASGVAMMKVDVAFSGRVVPNRHNQWRRDGLDLRIPGLVTGTFDHAVAGSAQAMRGQFPDDICMAIAVPTALDQSQAPAGQDTMYLFVCPVPAQPVEPWVELKPAAAKAVVARAAFLFDGVESLQIGRYEESPEDLGARTGATAGSWQHVDMTPMHMGPLRPALGLAGYRTPVEGLFLGGAGSHPVAGISGIPGRLAAKELLRGQPARTRGV